MNTAIHRTGSPRRPKASVPARLARHLKEKYQLYLMVLPAFILLICFYYVPMYGLQLAFKKYDPAFGLTGGAWVGMKYLNKFFNSYQFWTLIGNTLSISVTSLLLGFPLPIILALMINQIRKDNAKQFVQTVAYIPHFISTVAMVGMVRVMMSPTTGVWGHIYEALGASAPNVLASPSSFKWLYACIQLWQHTGWNSIIYVAALSSVDVQLYDAAKVDGANRLQQIFHIEIPSILPTVIILLILNIGHLLGASFEMIYLLQNDANIAASEVISTYVYKIGIKASNQISYSTAIGLFNNVVNFVLLILVNSVSKRVSDTSLF